MNRFVYLTNELKFDDLILPEFLVGIISGETEKYLSVSFTTTHYIVNIDKKYCIEFNPLQTGDNFPKKICNVCCRLLDTNKFPRNQNGKNNRVIRRPSCEDCREIIDGVALTAKEKQKWEKIKPNYEIFECPICHKRTIAGITSKVVLDHDHTTGKGRAWICDSCNTGIGRFKDDVKLLQNAIQYLQTK